MNLLQAITYASNNDMWFRPVAWRNLKTAYCVKDGCTYIVPSPSGGIIGMNTDTKTILGEWEVVFPANVNNGD